MKLPNDVDFGEPIETRDANYFDGYTHGIYKAQNIIDKQQKEIERLNNIIERIDSKLCSTWQLYYDHSRFTPFKCEDMLSLIEQIRKDIKELKEGKE